MPVNPRDDEARLLEHVREDLVREFPSLGPDVVDGQVQAVVQGLLRAPVRSFVPVLVRKGARQRLNSLRSASGGANLQASRS